MLVAIIGSTAQQSSSSPIPRGGANLSLAGRRLSDRTTLWWPLRSGSSRSAPRAVRQAPQSCPPLADGRSAGSRAVSRAASHWASLPPGWLLLLSCSPRSGSSKGSIHQYERESGTWFSRPSLLQRWAEVGCKSYRRRRTAHSNAARTFALRQNCAGLPFRHNSRSLGSNQRPLTKTRMSPTTHPRPLQLRASKKLS